MSALFCDWWPQLTNRLRVAWPGVYSALPRITHYACTRKWDDYMGRLHGLKPTELYVIPATHCNINEGKGAAPSAGEEVTSAAGP